MLVEGRGVIIEQAHYRPWRYALTLFDNNMVEGHLVMQGWEETHDMKAWYEQNKNKDVRLLLQGGRTLEVTLKGLRIHESGHYSQAEIEIMGTICKGR
ncbi:MAG: hypothetical protein J7K01_05290 [Thermovirga sp.]|nr:hypothetical protein [Thermovirga sp.]